MTLGRATPDYPRQGTLPNAAFGFGINNLGNVAFTRSSPNGDGYPMAYFYNKSTQATVALGSLPGAPIAFTDAFGINDNNIVVGDSVNGNWTCSATAWKWNGGSGGTLVDLGAVSGGFGTDANNWQEAYSINNNNQVTGYANTSPLVDGNGNGYPTPYVANVTNAFGGSPSITYQWLPRPGKTYSDAAGAGASINNNGAIAMSGESPVATQNGFYNGGTASSANSWVVPCRFPLAAAASSRPGRRPLTTPAISCARRIRTLLPALGRVRG